jgi:hypothetical protein
MFEQAIKLIGKPLNNPDLQALMTEHGFKQPKKAEISGRSSERSFWVEHKKLAINLLFDIETQNPHYAPFAGSKKGMWLPMLQQITFANPKLTYPFGLKIGLTHDETTKILGDFTFKSSDIHKVWLNDDGSESFYGWTKTIDAAKDLVLHTRINVGEKIRDIDIHPARMHSVFYLYDVFNNETIDSTLAATATLHEMAMFMEWAIHKGLYFSAAHLADIVAKVKNGSANGIDFLRHHTQCGRIFKEDFAPKAQEFVRQYGNNMSGHDILYSRDYVLSFLTNAKQRDNYMGDEAIETLKKVAYSDENKAKIFGVLDMRFAEFNAHGFAKSVVELKS